MRRAVRNSVVAALSGLLAFGTSFVGGAQGKAPSRVISLNLCTDQLLMLLARPEQIAGLTVLSRDCASAMLCDQARHFPVIRPDAEVLLAQKPDLVLGGTFTTETALLAARSVGARVETFAPVSSLAEIPEQIRRMAGLLSAPERGEALIRAFGARLSRLSTSPGAGAPVAAIYTANGWLTGLDSLPDDVLRHAGFVNFTATHGDGYTQTLPMEVLIAGRPDLLIPDPSDSGVSLAGAMLNSPALRSAFSGPHRLVVPASRWLCGLPGTLDALEALVKGRQALEASR